MTSTYEENFVPIYFPNGSMTNAAMAFNSSISTGFYYTSP